MGLFGGLVGLVGSIEVLGVKYWLFENFFFGYGFDAIVIVLLSWGNLLVVILIFLFFGFFRSGVNIM